MKTKGAKIIAPGNRNDIGIVNTNLQQNHSAMLPKFLTDLYQYSFGLNLTSAYIFGPIEIDRGTKYPIPSILDINKEFSGNPKLFGKTIFGRNDLFLFATDGLGNCFMLDNLTLSVLRKYDDPYRAMMDCLIIGKI